MSRERVFRSGRFAIGYNTFYWPLKPVLHQCSRCKFYLNWGPFWITLVNVGHKA